MKIIKLTLVVKLLMVKSSSEKEKKRNGKETYWFKLEFSICARSLGKRPFLV